MIELKSVEWSLQDKFNAKIDAVTRNPDFLVLKQIANNVPPSTYFALAPNFLFTPVTSCDVERSFSKFKDILTAKRNQFSRI